VLNGEGQHAVALPKVSYSVNSIDGPKPAAFCHLRILTGRRRPFRRAAGWSRGPDEWTESPHAETFGSFYQSNFIRPALYSRSVILAVKE
jgi:hypothetical protein